MTTQDSLTGLTSLEATLNARLASTKRWRRWTMIIGLLFFAIVGGYFFQMALDLKDLTKPDEVANFVGIQVFDLFRQTLSTYRTHARESVGDFTQAFVGTVFAQIPFYLKDAQHQLQGIIEASFENVFFTLETVVEKTYEERVDEFKGLLANLDTASGPYALEAYFYESLAEPLRHPEAQEGVQVLGDTLGLLHAKCAGLLARTDLTREEQNEREFLLLVRELWSRWGGRAATAADSPAKEAGGVR
jgi:hypothetical protein